MAAEENKHIVFTLGRETYGIPILEIITIERAMEITSIPSTPSFVRGIANLRGRIIPIIDLKDKVGIGAVEETDRVCVIIVDIGTGQGTQRYGLMVDEVSEVVNMEEEFIEPVPKYSNTSINQEFMSGIGKVKEKVMEQVIEKVIILLDIQKILEQEESMMPLV